MGLSDGGSINNLHNIDYHHQVYAFYGQDDWRVTPKLTLNLGLRYELFTTIKERNNELGTFDLSTGSLIVPKGVTAQLTPQLAAIVPVLATGTPGLISPDTNNFAPRIGLAYQATNKMVVRAGYGIFYGGDEAGPVFESEHGVQSAVLRQQEFQPALRCGFGQSGDGGLFPARHTYACQRLSGKFFDRSRAAAAFLFARSQAGHALYAAVALVRRSTSCRRILCSRSPMLDRGA